MKIIQTFLFKQIFCEQIRQTIIYLQKIVRYAPNYKEIKSTLNQELINLLGE